MKKVIKNIGLRWAIIIIVSVLFSENLFSASLEVFKVKKQGKAFGFYISDMLSCPEYSSLTEIIDSFTNSMTEYDFTNGVDFYRTNDFFIFFPQDKSDSYRADFIDSEINDLKEELENIVTKVTERVNPNRKKYIQAIPDKDFQTISGFKYSININEDQINSLESFINLRQKLEGFQSQKREINEQINQAKVRSTEIKELLKSYNSFRDMYKDLEKLEESIEIEMQSLFLENSFKKIVTTLYGVDGLVNSFLESGKSNDSRKLPTKKLNYDQLRKLVQQSTQDRSTKLLNLYLQMINIIFINQKQFQQIAYLCNDPYSEIVVLEISGFSFEISTFSWECKWNSKYISFGLNLLNNYVINLENLKGKTSLIYFDDDSKIADLENLKDIMPGLNEALSSINEQIMTVEESIKVHDLYLSKGKSTIDKLNEEYWVLKNLLDLNDDSEILITQDICIKYHSMLSQYVFPDISNLNLSYSVLCKRFSEKKKRLPDFYFSDGTCYVIGSTKSFK
jgi:hypothetical protein